MIKVDFQRHQKYALIFKYLAFKKSKFKKDTWLKKQTNSSDGAKRNFLQPHFKITELSISSTFINRIQFIKMYYFICFWISCTLK